MNGDGLMVRSAKSEEHEMIDDSAPRETGAKGHKVFTLRGKAVLGKNPVTDDGGRGNRRKGDFGRGGEDIGRGGCDDGRDGFILNLRCG